VPFGPRWMAAARRTATARPPSGPRTPRASPQPGWRRCVGCDAPGTCARPRPVAGDDDRGRPLAARA